MATKKTKKTETVVENTVVDTTAVQNTGAYLQEQLEKYANVSLRKLAIASKISYGWILKCSKEPIPGVPFDPSAVNYDRVAGVFTKRGIDLTTVDWETLNTEAARPGATLTKDMEAFKVKQLIYLREDNTTPFEICYKTKTHIVIMKVGTTEPRVWSHATFLMKGPVFTPRTTTKKSTTTTVEGEGK